MVVIVILTEFEVLNSKNNIEFSDYLYNDMKMFVYEVRYI